MLGRSARGEFGEVIANGGDFIVVAALADVFVPMDLGRVQVADVLQRESQIVNRSRQFGIKIDGFLKFSGGLLIFLLAGQMAAEVIAVQRIALAQADPDALGLNRLVRE